MSHVAVLGLGSMGSGMARALLKAGHAVTVFNRTRSKAQALGEAGATVADSPAEAVRGAEVVLLSLTDEAAVEDILFGQLAGGLRLDQPVIDTTTVSPAFAREAARRSKELGLRRIEACVVGNPIMASSGHLRVFTAGAYSDTDAVRDVLAAFSQSVFYLGGVGQASSLKLAFNVLLGVQTTGLAEAVALAEAGGLDRALLLDALESSGWRSPVLSFRSRFMRERTYAPAGFRSELMHKDLLLAQEEAAAHDVQLPVTACAAGRYGAVLSAGRGDEDAAVVVEA